MRYDTHRIQDPNRVGNIPMHWYDDMPHIGYDINGKEVLRPAMGDELDKFLKTQEDPTAWYVLTRLSRYIAEFGVAGCLL
jgi:ribosome biogenesis protein ERB1